MEGSALTAFQLFGVVAVNDMPVGALAPGTEVIAFRDVGAVVSRVNYELPVDEEHRHYRRVVECVFRQQEILPAPPGVVFRSQAVLMQWLELHHFTLLDALVFVEERAMARVTVDVESDHGHRSLADGTPEDVDDGRSVHDALRVLRRHVVATVGLGGRGGDDEEVDEHVTVVSFLVQQDRWEPFMRLVDTESDRLSGFSLRVTGPWPPYDFIRMQFSN